MRISDWSSDVCSSDLIDHGIAVEHDQVHHCRGGEVQFVEDVRCGRPQVCVVEDAPADRVRPRPEAIAALVMVDPTHLDQLENGRASCRERVCQYVEIWVAAVSLKKKQAKKKNN